MRFLLILFFLTFSMGGCIITPDDLPFGVGIHGDDSYSTFTVWNDSSYVIEEIYVSSSNNRDWGPDVLGHDVLYPDEEITIAYLDCDFYDVMVVDEDQVECILDGISLCFDDDTWIITDRTLDNCS